MKSLLLTGFSLSILFIFGSACSTSRPKERSQWPLKDLLKEDSKRLSDDEIQKLVRGHLKPDSFRKFVHLTDPTKKQEEKIRSRIVRWLQHYVLDSPYYMKKTLARGNKHKLVVEKELDAHGLPKELYYLALVESNFDHSATSSVGAVGYWQLMPETAKIHGLKVNLNQDDRKDVSLATQGAAKYLKRLYRRFQSWYLTIAAYNSGPEKISRAVAKGKTNNFWELMEYKLLPQETLDYIPKFLAVWLIGENPHLFDLEK